MWRKLLEFLDHYKTCARYNTWMNGKIYAVCAELPDEERKRDLGAFFHSIHGTLNHLLLGDRNWLGRLIGPEHGVSWDAAGEPIAVSGHGQELYSDFGYLRRERIKTDTAIESWIERLAPEQLHGDVTYKMMDGVKSFQHPLWWAISHLFNHQTHHRGQVTTMLKQLGRDPGATDLIAMLRSEA